MRKDDPALRFRGWTETHTWAWVFTKGKPVGMTVTIQGGKILDTSHADVRREARALSLEGKTGGAAVDRMSGTLDRPASSSR